MPVQLPIDLLRRAVKEAKVQDINSIMRKYPVIPELKDPNNIGVIFDFIKHLSDTQAKMYIDKIFCQASMEKPALLSYLSVKHRVKEKEKKYNLAYYAFSLNKLRTAGLLVHLGAPMDSLGEIIRCVPNGIYCKHLQEHLLAGTDTKDKFVKQLIDTSPEWQEKRQTIVFTAIKKNNPELLKFLWLLDPEGLFLFVNDKHGFIPLHHVIQSIGAINSKGNIIKAQLEQLFRKEKVNQLTYRNHDKISPLHSFFDLYGKQKYKELHGTLLRLYVWLFGSSLDLDLVSGALTKLEKYKSTVENKHAKLTLQDLEKIFDHEIEYQHSQSALPAEKRNLFLYIAKAVKSDICFHFYQHVNREKEVVPLLSKYKALARLASRMFKNDNEGGACSIIKSISNDNVESILETRTRNIQQRKRFTLTLRNFHLEPSKEKASKEKLDKELALYLKENTEAKNPEDVNRIDTFIQNTIVPQLKPENYVGEGGFGKVFRATYISKFGVPVLYAVKSIDHFRPISNSSANAKVNASIEIDTEIKVHEKVNENENIIKLYSSYTNQNITYLFLEFATVGSLRNYLDETKENGQNIPWSARQSWSIQIEKGLQYVHGKGVFHRDLKGANILLEGPVDTPDKLAAKLTDFGSAKAIKEAQQKHQLSSCAQLSVQVDSSASADDVLFAATLPWKERELLMEDINLNTGTCELKKKKPDAASDVYSYGMILYEIITRSLPYYPLLALTLLEATVNKAEEELKRENRMKLFYAHKKNEDKTFIQHIKSDYSKKMYPDNDSSLRLSENEGKIYNNLKDVILDCLKPATTRPTMRAIHERFFKPFVDSNDSPAVLDQNNNNAGVGVHQSNNSGNVSVAVAPDQNKDSEDKKQEPRLACYNTSV